MSSSSDSSSRRCCSHLLAYRSSSRPFHSLLPCLRPRSSPLGRAEISRDPHEVPRCSLCPNSPTIGNLPSSFSPRLLACLTCAAVLCPSHAPSHSHHDIAVDVDRAELFCLRCSDQIYDPDFDSTVLLSLSSTNANANANANVAATAIRKRRRVNYLPWTPDPVETSIICKGSRALRIDDTTLASASNSHTCSSGVEESSPVGVRGMNNLGNTCFMGSVLQALMHTPPMRNYFLSDKHNRFVCCQMKGRRKKSGGSGGSGNVCLACDLDEMYSGVFLGDRTPYSPAKFLYR